MKILLAGPGTGKTTNIKDIITKHGDGSKFLVLSFTNATVNDLQVSLKELGIAEDNCMTLHKFAVKYNHDYSRHVLHYLEEEELKTIAKGTGIEFNKLCDFLVCTTFDQMIGRFVDYAKANPLYLADKLRDYDSLIVDEYQDFNPNEQALIDILIEKINTAYVLGDDDQCIYDFKDASSDKIISFFRDVNNEKIAHKHICYRCPDDVVDHASNLIRENKKRIDKQWLKNGNPGGIKYLQLRTFDEVADAIYNEVKRLPNEDVLILSPVEFAVDPIARKFADNHLDYANYFSDKVSVELVAKAWEVKALYGRYKYLNLVLLGYLRLKNRKKLYELLKLHFDGGADYNSLFKLLERKMPDNMKNDGVDLEVFLAGEYYRDIKSLYDSAKGKTPEEKLENMFRIIDKEEEKNIKIMSIHKSKGLGADYVFIVGLIEGILPNKQRGNDSIESQRRRFYVGMTRAKKQLYLYSNFHVEGKHVNKVNKNDFKYVYKSRMYEGKASTFITELKLK